MVHRAPTRFDPGSGPSQVLLVGPDDVRQSLRPFTPRQALEPPQPEVRARAARGDAGAPRAPPRIVAARARGIRHPEVAQGTVEGLDAAGFMRERVEPGARVDIERKEPCVQFGEFVIRPRSEAGPAPQ